MTQIIKAWLYREWCWLKFSYAWNHGTVMAPLYEFELRLATERYQRLTSK
ncbi:hypothetical protein [Silvimonas soli]|nr:hypothetical protein [Silvimonas soli]